MVSQYMRVTSGEHTFSAEVLRQFRGHPFSLVFDTLRHECFPVRARDGLLIPEPGCELTIRADRDSVTYGFRQATATTADQLADGV